MRLIILCVSVGVAWGPSWGQTKNQTAPPIKPPDSKTAQAEPLQVTSQGGAIILQPNSPHSQAYSTSTEGGTAGKDFYDKLAAFSAAAVAILTLALVVVGARAVRAANRTLGAIQDQVTRMDRQIGLMEGQQTSSDRSSTETLAAIQAQSTTMTEQVGVMKQQVEAAAASNKAFIHSQRPWLSVSVSLGGDLTYHEAGITFPILVVINNVGKIPAIGTTIVPRAHIYDESHQVFAERDKISEHLKATTKKRGQVIFPDNPVEQRYGISAPSADIESRLNDIPGLDTKFFGISVIVVVGYRATMDDSFYYTGAIYTLARIGNDYAPGFEIGRSVKQDSLFLFNLSMVGDAVE